MESLEETLETRRKLGRVNFRKDFWDCYQGREKNWPIAAQHVPSNDPRNQCATHYGTSPLLVSEATNVAVYQLNVVLSTSECLHN